MLFNSKKRDPFKQHQQQHLHTLLSLFSRRSTVPIDSVTYIYSRTRIRRAYLHLPPNSKTNEVRKSFNRHHEAYFTSFFFPFAWSCHCFGISGEQNSSWRTKYRLCIRQAVRSRGKELKKYWRVNKCKKELVNEKKREKYVCLKYKSFMAVPFSISHSSTFICAVPDVMRCISKISKIEAIENSM